MGIKKTREYLMKNTDYASVLSDKRFSIPQRIYIFEKFNPEGDIFRKSYYSFPKGAQASEEVAEEIAKECNVSVEHLVEGAALFTFLRVNPDIRLS